MGTLLMKRATAPPAAPPQMARVVAHLLESEGDEEVVVSEMCDEGVGGMRVWRLWWLVDERDVSLHPTTSGRLLRPMLAVASQPSLIQLFL